MKKWMIIAAAFLVSVPIGVFMYQAFHTAGEPEDLAPETKPVIAC